MSLHLAFTRLLQEYPSATYQPFIGNHVANFVRRDIPAELSRAVGNNDRYVVRGSAGQGNWARLPWVAVYDRFITETAQDGYYVVYLVAEDFSGFFLSLNQGVTIVRRMYGIDAKEALAIRASDYLARLGHIRHSLVQGAINLKVRNTSTLGAFYEKGSICAKYYQRDQIPYDNILLNDLRVFLELYATLSQKELVTTSSTTEEDEFGLNGEDLTVLREHKRIERNRKLAEHAKKVHGYICQACGSNFEEVYGSLGRQYIEAHHLTPLNVLKGRKVALDPKKDFAVLCANCHRMIHRSDYVGSISEFKLHYLPN